MSAMFRLRAGLLLGAGAGLVYELVAQTINSIALPGIPLYQPPPGPAGSVLLGAVIGASLGTICAWPQSSVLGILWSGTAGAALLFAAAVVNAASSPKMLAGVLLFALYSFLPLAALLAVGTGALRWAINQQEEARAALPQWLIPAGMLTLAAVWGAFSLYPPEARQVLTRMNSLVLAGQAAPDAASLPQAFQSDEINDYIHNARGQYWLTWDNSNLDRFPIRRPATRESEQSAAIAYFENGWTLVCLFATPNAAPECIGLSAP